MVKILARQAAELAPDSSVLLSKGPKQVDFIVRIGSDTIELLGTRSKGFGLLITLKWDQDDVQARIVSGNLAGVLYTPKTIPLRNPTLRFRNFVSDRETDVPLAEDIFGVGPQLSPWNSPKIRLHPGAYEITFTTDVVYSEGYRDRPDEPIVITLSDKFNMEP